MGAPVKANVTIKDFEKLDIRVGKILSVEDVEGSDKLVGLTVDFGDFRRAIAAGMKKERPITEAEAAAKVSPIKRIRDEIEGKQALFVVNLEPRKMMGIVSEGMLFDIGYPDGIIPVLAVPEKPVPDGVRAG